MHTLVLVHVASKATDVGLIHFHCFAFAAHLFEGLALHRKSDSVEHEPSGLLSDTKSAVDFVRTNAVLRAADQPHSGKPLRQRNRTLFKDRSSLHRKLFLAIKAFPYAASSQVACALR